MHKDYADEKVYFLFAVSPLLAMRSAPVITAEIRPDDINDAEAASGRSVAGTPICDNSHIVKRAPCRSGRVSVA